MHVFLQIITNSCFPCPTKLFSLIRTFHLLFKQGSSQLPFVFYLYFNTGNTTNSFIQNAVQRTIQRQAELETTMERFAETYQLRAGDFSDEEEDSPCPLMDMFIQEMNGRSVVKTMTPFTSQMFDSLWDQVGVDFTVGI